MLKTILSRLRTPTIEIATDMVHAVENPIQPLSLLYIFGMFAFGAVLINLNSEGWTVESLPGQLVGIGVIYCIAKAVTLKIKT